MAKQLKQGENFATHFGDQWDQAILVVDRIELNYLEQEMLISVDVYMDATARTNKNAAMSESYQIDKATFLANFNTSESILNLKAQAEDYALLIDDGEGGLMYDQFE